MPPQIESTPPQPQSPFSPPSPDQPPAPQLPMGPQMPGPHQHASKKLWLVLGAVGLVIVLAGAAVTYLVLTQSKNDSANPTQTQNSDNTDTTTPVNQNIVMSDMYWSLPESVSGDWTKQPSQEGEYLYKYRSSSCTVLVAQPDGMKAEGITQDKQLLDADIGTLAQQLGESAGKIEKTNKGVVYYDTTAKTTTDKLGMTAMEAYFPTLLTKAYMVAYVNGDYALSILAHCTSDDYSSYFGDAVAPFMKTFKADLLP